MKLTRVARVNISLVAILLFITFADLYLDFHVDTFMKFRLPRVLGALVCGFSLSMCGVVLQTLFRNPLAGPFLTGITPAASFFIGLSILLIPSFLYSIPYFEFIGASGFAMAGAVLILLLQLRISKRSSSGYVLLLTGVMFGYFLNAGTEVLQSIASANQLQQYVLWGMGNFDRILIWQVFVLFIVFVVILSFILSQIGALDVFLLGDEYAALSGIHVNKFRRNIILSTGVLAAICTVFCGPIGFVGLATPHIAKMALNNQMHRRVLIPSILAGGIFCVLSDLLSHLIFKDLTITVNAVSALLGAPIILWVMLKRKSS